VPVNANEPGELVGVEDTTVVVTPITETGVVVDVPGGIEVVDVLVAVEVVVVEVVVVDGLLVRMLVVVVDDVVEVVDSDVVVPYGDEVVVVSYGDEAVACSRAVVVVALVGSTGWQNSFTSVGGQFCPANVPNGGMTSRS
jgi:hypothetical protein